MTRLPRSPQRGATGPRRRRLLAAAATATAALALSACSSATVGAPSPASNGQSFVSGSASTTVYAANTGPLAPTVTGTTLTGARLSLSSYRGHVVVLNFWGSWCSPCRAEAPILAALDRKFAPSGVAFLGVDTQDTVDAALAFEQDFRITYPSWNDQSDEIALAFRSTVPPEGLPSTLVIAKDGRIVARIVGEVSYQGLSRLISDQLAHPA